MSTEATKDRDGNEYETRLNALRVAVKHLNATEESRVQNYESLIDDVAYELKEQGELDVDTMDQFADMLHDLYNDSRRAQNKQKELVEEYEDDQEQHERLQQKKEEREEDSQYLVKKGDSRPELDEYTTQEMEKKREETQADAYRRDVDAVLGGLQIISEVSDESEYQELREEVEQYHQRKQED